MINKELQDLVYNYKTKYEEGFTDLEIILRLLNEKGVVSRLYDVFPVSIDSLMYKRKIGEDQEITHLAILPRVSTHGDGPFVGREFIKDMKYI